MPIQQLERQLTLFGLLKGHGNEADFLGFLQKSVPYTTFEPFRVGESMTLRLGESGSRHGESGSRYSKFFKFIVDFLNFERLNQPFKGPI
jgi:hypothetical protein